MPAVIGALRAELSATVGQFVDDLGRAANEVQAFGRRTAKVGRELTAAGRSLTVGITLPVLAMGGAAIEASADFETAMKAVGISTKGTAEEIAAMRRQARDIGKDTIFSASEAASAMDMLAKNGLETTLILNGAAKATVDLAAAAGSELDPAAAAVTDSINQFKLGAKDLPMIVNQITGAVNESKFDFQDYTLAIGQAGGVANTAGVEFKDFNATLAGTSSLFASGSDAGTSFKNFLVRLVPQSKMAGQLMEALKLEFFDANGAMKSMPAIAENLKTSLGGLNEETRNFVLKELFGTDAMRTAVGLMDLGAEGLENIKDRIAEVDAAAQAAKRMEGLNGQLEELKGALEELGIALGESGLLEFATDMVRSAGEFVEKLAELNPELLKWGMILAGIAAVVGPILLFVGSLATGLASLIAILPILTGLFGAFWVAVTGPIGLTVAAVLGLIAVWVLFEDEIKEMAANVVKFVVGIYDGVKRWLGDKLGNILAWVSKRVVALIEPFRKLYMAVVGGSYVPDMVKGILKNYDELDKKGAKKIKRATDTVAEAFKDLKDRVNKGLDGINLPESIERANDLRRRLADIEDDARTKGVSLKQFAGSIKEITDAIEELETAGLSKEAVAFAGDVEKAKRAVREFAKGELPPLEAALQDVDSRYESLRQRILDEIEANRGLADVNEQAAASMAALEDQLAALEKAHDTATEAAKAQHVAEQELADLHAKREAAGIQGEIDELREARGEGGLLTKGQEALRDAERALQNERMDALIRLRELETAKAEAERVGDEEEAQRLRGLIELAGIYYQEVSDTTALQIEAARRVKDAYQEFTQTLEDEVTDMISKWEFDLEGLHDAWRQLAKEMFIRPGVEALGGLVKSGIGSIFQNFAGGFALGGTIRRGQWGIVGENGPEPVFAGSGDLEVFPNGSMGRGVTQVFNIGQMTQDTFRMTKRQYARVAKTEAGL